MLRLNIESRHGGFLGPQGRPTMASVIKSGRFFPYDAVKQLRVDMVVPSLSASESDLSGDFWLMYFDFISSYDFVFFFFFFVSLPW